MMPSLPTVVILTTGGTIASRLDPATGAVRPLVSGRDLLAALPQAAEVAQVEVEEVCAVPSWNMTPALMVDLARRNRFPWDAILGAEIAGDFKPKPRVYLAACEALDLAPDQCMMVAAHSNDLAAAAACGLRTAHISRMDEHGPGRGEPAPKVPVDVAAASLTELADRLGA